MLLDSFCAFISVIVVISNLNPTCSQVGTIVVIKYILRLNSMREDRIEGLRRRHASDTSADHCFQSWLESSESGSSDQVCVFN